MDTAQGDVIAQTVAADSKSEHTAVVLKTADDRAFVLRRPGANPFVDPELQTLVGKRVEVTGTLSGSTFFVDSSREVD